jgi:uncharacterized cupredoxin-like copper-binding protein
MLRKPKKLARKNGSREAVSPERSRFATSQPNPITYQTGSKESEYKLSPSSVTLSKPGTYAFKALDKGSTQHSLTIEGKGLKGQGGEATLKQVLSPGQSGVLTVTFHKGGTYEMYCPVDGHEQIGMKGKVVVK